MEGQRLKRSFCAWRASLSLRSGNLLPKDGIAWRMALIERERANKLMQELVKEVNWKQEKIFIFGREVLQPRLSAWFGGEGRPYRYSGLELAPREWSPKLFEIKTLIEKTSGREFNSALLNYYRDGQDSMGWHRDNEQELGPNPVIASLSLGQKRRFILRHYKEKTLKVPMELGEGELLIMEGESQRKWEHGVPKTARKLGPSFKHHL